ncbi:MAG: hypothetical protein M3Y09_02780 [Actinomycetota bacterium]|nr:hypothetical protein [Actinomycetota bacterium]
MSQPPAEPPHLPPATEQQARSHAPQLVSLGARHGITRLAFASPGQIRGHIADDRDLFDMFEFQRAATDLLGAEVIVYSDGALRNDHASPAGPSRCRSAVTEVRPERHALLELQALLTQITAVRSEGDADRFITDDRYRWVLHRLWIAAGNEALAFTRAIGQPVRADNTRANLNDLCNHLAHSRLPDIDESLVRRFTWTRLDSLQATTRHHLQARL